MFSVEYHSLTEQLEILRLYTPFARMARWTETEQQLAGHTIPAGTELLLAPALVHVSPEVYGDNRLDFLPTRWQKDDSTIAPGPDGTHFPWSLGPRVCPGKKFSQVEFVSVIYEVFSQFKVEIAQVEGESVDQARAKVQDAVRNGVPNSALTPRNPDQVKLRLVPRKL